ncbi:MAG: hypothetical protein NTZ85_01690, partial [Bacteroidia bacterium]|nr:hypothetical protein [Bacteroidia bacterium]
PEEGFKKLAERVKKEGVLHIMVYNIETQGIYSELRKTFKKLSQEARIKLCKEMGGEVHGWYDALNPEYNHGFSVEEMKALFTDAGFHDIRVIMERNININGIKQ